MGQMDPYTCIVSLTFSWQPCEEDQHLYIRSQTVKGGLSHQVTGDNWLLFTSEGGRDQGIDKWIKAASEFGPGNVLGLLVE